MMFLQSWLGFLRPDSSRPRTKQFRTRQRTACRPQVELLEDRRCPSGGYLFVPSYNTDNVLRYNETSGAFVNEFAPHKSGGLHQPEGLIMGPDHNLYVSSGLFSG